MNQLPLFNAPKIKTKDISFMALALPSLCYEKLREREMQIPNSIWFVVDKGFQTDWNIIYDEFEDNGSMTFIDIKIQDTNIKCFEYEMEIFIKINDGSDLMIYSRSENDVFDNKYLTKIKKKLKAFIFDNAFQFNLK